MSDIADIFSNFIAQCPPMQYNENNVNSRYNARAGIFMPKIIPDSNDYYCIRRRKLMTYTGEHRFVCPFSGMTIKRPCFIFLHCLKALLVNPILSNLFLKRNSQEKLQMR